MQPKRHKPKQLSGELAKAVTLPIEYRLLIGGIAFTGIVLVGKYVFIDPIKNLKENTAQNQAAYADSPAGIASEIWAAGNDGWFGWEEDEERIVACSKRIKGYAFYEDIIKAYRNLTKGRELHDDLVHWLDGEQYQQFKSNIAQNQALL